MGMNETNSAPAKSGVKYHLVEAEEVDDKTHQPITRSTKNKRKGKLNWSQFPLEGEENATPERDEGASSYNSKTISLKTNKGPPNQHHVRNGRGPRTGGRFGGRRQYPNCSGYFYNGVFVPTPDVTVTAQWAKSQIEFYFTSDNLVRDIFLRQHMDVDGYVPLAFVGSFQAVYSVHQDYESLLEAMKDSETLELDMQNEKIRLREGWEKWVWPNAEGGYGVPRYIKETNMATMA